MRYDARMNNDTAKTFHGLGIAPPLLRRLDAEGFITPTPIQHKAIPAGVRGEDIIGIAQTGTGKTLAFCIPMMQRLSMLKKQGLIICPTRELAIQVNETLHKIGKKVGLSSIVIIGGTSIKPQIQGLKRRPNVIVGTPGRLNDHLQQRTFKLDKIGVLVLDEADRMLDMGFEPQIRKIMSDLPKDRQTLLFSATMPGKITQIARKYMTKPLRIEVARAGTTTDQVEQELYIVKRQQKLPLLVKLLQKYQGTVLVFSRTKHGAKKMARKINALGCPTAELHSNRSLNQRREALEGFKSGKYRVMIATDIAARGIDVTEIELVVNFDLPDHSEDYVHRIGRTGRASHCGRAISFACPDQTKELKAIEKLIKMRLPVLPLPNLPQIHSESPGQKRGSASRRSTRESGGSGQGGGSRAGQGRPRSRNRGRSRGKR